MSWTLSCLQLNRYYDDTVLYADSVSARMLVDQLQLPYKTVCCELDKLNKFDPRLWALPKIYAYSKQDLPFLHVDADVFIWKSFDAELLSGGLIAQNIEVVNQYYESIMRLLEAHLNYFPKEIISERNANSEFCAYNAGIMGGNDIDFFKEYTSKAFNFALKNTDKFDRINVGDFNVFFEQYLFYCLAKEKNKKVEVLIPEILREYIGFGEFTEVPHNKQFLHLLGQYKAHKACDDQMADRLRLDYPEYYYRIISLFRDKRYAIKRTFYTSNDNCTERELVASYYSLREKFKNSKLQIFNENCTIRTFEPYGLKTKLVKNAADVMICESNKRMEDYQAHLIDVENFENDINSILVSKFSQYSLEYLYARDINFTAYFSIVFGDKEIGRNIKIITDPIYEILESQYDWSEVDSSEFGRKIIMEQFDLAPLLNYTALVPECCTAGYSLINIDDLDLTILELCKNTSTINELFKALEPSFNPSDVIDYREEFEELISGRIKIALVKKLIKVVLG